VPSSNDLFLAPKRHVDSAISQATGEANSVYSRRLLHTSRYAGATALLIAISASTGWVLGIPALMRVQPHFVTTKMNSALGFVLLSIALFLLAPDSSSSTDAAAPAATTNFRRAMIRLCAGLATLIALLTLAEYALQIDFGVDELFVKDTITIPGTVPPGRMAVGTALNLLLLSLAFLTTDIRIRGRFHPADWFNGIVAVGAFIALLGYCYGVKSIYNPAAPGSIGLPSALACLVISVGFWCAQPTRGFTARAIANDAGGVLIRRLFPAAVFIPPLVGWFRLRGQEAGWYGTEFGLALFATSNVLIFAVLVAFTARGLRTTDAHRSLDEKKLRVQLAKRYLLQDIAHAMVERQDLQSIFQVVVNKLEDDLQIDFTCVALVDPASETMTVTSVGIRSAALAMELGLLEQQRIAVDLKGLALCLRGQIIYEPDLDRRQSPFMERLAEAGLRALVAAPLILKDKIFGLIITARRESQSFTSIECEFLCQLSEHVSLAGQQAENFAALQRAYEELRTTQQAMIQTERLHALGQLASGIAHDINNALSPAAVYAQLLLERDRPLDAETRDWLALIQRAIQDAANTVTRMLEFSRLGDDSADFTPLQINQLVRHAAAQTRPRWHDSPRKCGILIDFKISPAADMPNIVGAESEIGDAVVNLILNAIDAMPEGGTLMLRTQILTRHGASPNLQPTHISLEVSDTGVGMSEESRRRCLEPFFSTKGKRGTGLGLAMVYGMARRHGADMEIESVPGRGTTVRITFAAEHVSTPKVHIDEPLRPVRSLNILVVDDDPLVLKSVGDMLRYDGHRVLVATGGKHGIEAFSAAYKGEDRVSVVISDLGMPDVDGGQVAAAVKAMSPTTPVIILTGWGRGAELASLHVDRVLSKPPKLGTLRQALAELCDQPQMDSILQLPLASRDQAERSGA
jgi:signal transduction histidine kinase/ActR/RegA family two-component response regulator